MAKQTITRALLRLAADASNRANFRDSLTSQTPQIWRGNVLRVDVGLFAGLANYLLTTDDQIINLTASGLQSLTLEVKAALSTTAANLMAKTVSVFDDTLTSAIWNAGTGQHATFLFSDSETNIAAGQKFLILSGVTSAGPFTFGVTEFTVLEDGTPGDAPDPQTNPGSAISVAQADARYAALGADSGTSKRGKLALTNGGTGAVAIAFTTPFAGTPTSVQVTLALPGATADTFNVYPDESSLSAAGFNVIIPAGVAVPAANYFVHWQAFYDV
jgi:hypothetical protein